MRRKSIKLTKLITQENDVLVIDSDPYIKTGPKWDRVINRIPFGWCFYNKVVSLRMSIKSLFQKILRGFSDEECRNLNDEIAKFILKRLLYFKKMERFNSPIFSEKDSLGKESAQKWDEVLDEMIFAFDFTCDPLKYNNIPGTPFEETGNTPEAWDDYFKRELELEIRKAQGLALFVKHFHSLWA